MERFNSKAIIPSIADINRQFSESLALQVGMEQAEKQAERSHRANVESLLSEIADNTSSINLMVEILQSSNETQKDILQEILTIGTAINSEEAESKYKKVMKQITEKVDNIESAEKLLTMSKAVYHAGVAYFKVNNGG